MSTCWLQDSPCWSNIHRTTMKSILQKECYPTASIQQDSADNNTSLAAKKQKENFKWTLFIHFSTMSASHLKQYILGLLQTLKANNTFIDQYAITHLCCTITHQETFMWILKLVGIPWNRTSVEVVNKLSSTSVDFIRSERKLENMHLYGV